MSEFVETPTTPTVSDTTATSAPTVNQSAPVAATPTTPNVAPQPPATGGEPSVPSYRLRQQREQYEARIAQVQAQKDAEWQAKYDQIQRQLHSLVGVTPPANPQEDQIRQQFNGLYQDSLAKLADPKVVERLLQYVEKAPDFEAQTQHYWNTYNTQSLNTLYSKAEEAYGKQLGPVGRASLKASLIEYLNENPEAAERYNNADNSVIVDFWKAFSSELVDPVRRSATAQVVDRVPHGIPQDTPSIPRTSAPQQPANLDERVNMAWSQFNKAVKG